MTWRTAISGHRSNNTPGRSVNELIAAGFPVTAELGLYALLVALGIGGLAGVCASLKPNTAQDYTGMSLAMIGICMPSFPVKFCWCCCSASTSTGCPCRLAIPATRSCPPSPWATPISHAWAGPACWKSRPRIISARPGPRACPGGRVVFTACVAAPSRRFLPGSSPVLLAGSFVVETIFQIPGLGRFGAGGVQPGLHHDPGTTVFLSVLIVLFNLLSDILAAWMNPRLRAQFGDTR